MVDQLYPAGPADAGNQLAKASPAYRRHAWFAMVALLAFVLAYLLFSGWLAWKAYFSIRASIYGSRDGMLLTLVGLGAAFLAVFMLKALVFVRRGQMGGLTEITAAEQPRLFAFLHRLADEARAPRPAKVYVSSRVNAAVFYDLSLLNFFLPSKKNLEIGLPLVNVLTVSEFKAVLAHEFGHFAQRSMAVGRWVYLAQQIAAHIVAKRDGLDRFLEGLSRTDVRIAWIGWLFSLLVWSIRSVVDSLFRVVVLADRALSREMEFQADRVSVSLAGSDALIDALYKMQAADTAWDRTLEFANQQLHKGRAAPDLYDLQSTILQKLRVIYDDPGYGVPPPVPADGPAAHRIFKRDRVSVSRMWATHPASHEREDNAKKVYLAAEACEDSAWALFDEAQAFRERNCRELISHVVPPPETATREAMQEALDAEYNRESYKRRYRGVYLGRAVTRSQHTAEQLFDRIGASQAAAALPGLYPESLSGALERLDALLHERAALVAVQDGIARSEGPRLEHRGKAIKKRELAGAIDEVARDITEAERELETHDRLCRSTARALAAVLGPEWEAGWLAQLRLLNYAEHVEANLTDLQSAMLNTLAMVTAKRKTNEAEAQRVVANASALFTGMAEIAKDAPGIEAGPDALALMGHESWSAMVGEFNFGYPTRENINEWLKASDSWVRPMVRALGSLRRAALDQLLRTEARLGDVALSQAPAGEVPPAPVLPGTYATLTNGQERPRQKKLDAWSRFQTADGWWAGAARLAVAGGVIASLMGISTTLGSASVVAYNGLDREVKVRVGGSSATLPPGGKRTFEVEADKKITLGARTVEGQEIESFSANPELIGVRYVYNVAGAAPMVAWTAVYGQATQPPERKLGAPRWSTQSADALFEPPPRQITTSKGSGGGTRSVVSGPETRSANNNLNMVDAESDRKALIEAHGKWDSGQSAYLLEWLAAAEQQAPESYAQIVAERVARAPLEVVSLREQQNLASSPEARESICEQHRALARANPGVIDLGYLVVRCMSDQAAKDVAFKKGAAEHPDSAWFAYAAGHAWAGEQAWPEARRAYERAGAKAPFLSTVTTDDLARIRRVEQGESASLDDLRGKSSFLQIQQILETGKDIPPDSSAFGYIAMSKGQLDKAFGLATSGTQPPVRLLVLIGASDGANQKQVAKALEASPSITVNDFDALLPAIGLAIKHGRSADKPMELLKYMSPEDARKVREFVTVLKTTQDARRAEEAIAGLTVQYRAQAYSAGLIVLGDRAPAQWRRFVKRALFPAEHPYFG
ncbi:M48 family metallopeptidase [Variovorax sp. EL159]|uniref:M48 family metallopeptidase n=1 Tax=Variovorax sp. EL159 TaxID=1566270 RepID=UPI00088DB02B|nr:M48 family metallopeptidase [Variovorax sp. EL159]SCX62261.1 Zn-dependent protease with chaperone function [Variovorax sp. EL159]